MKLRLFVLLMVLANLAFGVWSLGWLDSLLGVTARTDREPNRVLQQVNPQAMTVLPPGASPKLPASRTPSPPSLSPSSKASAPAPASLAASVPLAMPSDTVAASAPSQGTVTICLEAADLSTAQLTVAEKALAALPASAWRRVALEQPASFGAVMGPFPTREALRTKVAELERLKLTFERAPQPNADGTVAAAAPTLLVLARTGTRDEATKSLAGLAQRGVRTARVVQLTAATTMHRLVVDGANEGQAQALKANGSGIDGEPFTACAP